MSFTHTCIIHNPSRVSFLQQITLPSAGERNPCSTHTWWHRNEQLTSSTIWFTFFRTVTTTSLTFSHLDVINPQWQICTYRGQWSIIMTAQNDRCHGQGCQISALTLKGIKSNWEHFKRTSYDWQVIINPFNTLDHVCTHISFFTKILLHLLFQERRLWNSLYLVLVFLPTSCCSRMRTESCCLSDVSFPWACLMNGCSSRCVTDGRVSKSFIKHLQVWEERQETRVEELKGIRTIIIP